MTTDVMIEQLAGLTTLTKQDVDDLKSLSPQDAALVMRTYEDMGKVADRGLWVKIGNALKEVGEYAGVAGIIFAAIPLL